MFWLCNLFIFSQRTLTEAKEMIKIYNRAQEPSLDSAGKKLQRNMPHRQSFDQQFKLAISLGALKPIKIIALIFIIAVYTGTKYQCNHVKGTFKSEHVPLAALEVGLRAVTRASGGLLSLLHLRHLHRAEFLLLHEHIQVCACISHKTNKKHSETEART